MELIDEPELTPDLIQDRYRSLLQRLRGVAGEAGRDPSGFRVVAVTKGFGVSAVRAALAAGMTTFGENRVQEAAPKVEAAPDADWHLVGRLQSNKVRPALRLFGTIHSVDSLELLERIARIAHDDGRRPRLLLQVKMADEPDRSGFELDWFASQVRTPGGSLVEALGAFRDGQGAQVVGLMAMASLDGSEAAAQFATLRQLRDELRTNSGLELPELSMGMTSDAEAAVREGATLLRIGAAIFGPRPEHH
jgi:pyridoxal phosphate enzyme (YggS family)